MKDSQRCRAEEHLVSFRVRYRSVRLPESVRTLAHQLTEHTPVPFVRRSSPLRWAVAVNEAIVEHIRSPIAVTFIEVRECAAEPQIVASRCDPGDCPEHRAGSVRGVCDFGQTR